MTPPRGAPVPREESSCVRVVTTGERVAGETDRDGGKVAELGEGMEERCLCDEVADDHEEVREPETRRKQIGGKGSDGKEPVTGADVAGVHVGGIHCAETDSAPEADSDDECRPDVSGGEGGRRGAPAEATLDWSNDR